MPQDRAESAGKNSLRSSAGRLKGLDRRALLGAVAVLAGLDATGLATAEADEVTFSLEGFRELLSALTGFSPRDVSLVVAFRDAFTEELSGLRTLSDIVANSPESDWPEKIKGAGLEPLAESLVTAAYTGMSGEGANARVITYLNAFVWHACGYVKPPSQCDWDFGAWAYPPPRGRFEE